MVEIAVEGEPVEKRLAEHDWGIDDGERWWHEDFAQSLTDLEVRARAVADDPESVGVELAFPRAADGFARAAIDRVFAKLGFDRKGASRPMLDEPCVHYDVAHYFRAPQRLLRMEPGDSRVPHISAALWEEDVPFVWQLHDEGGLELWCPGALANHALSAILLSAHLESEVIPFGFMATCAGRAPRTANTTRIAVLGGERREQVTERLRQLAVTPQEPWVIEVLCDVETMDLVVDVVVEPRMRPGGSLLMTYGWIGLQQSTELVPGRSLFRALFGLAPVSFTHRHWATCSTPDCAVLVERLWLKNLPCGWEYEGNGYSGTPSVSRVSLPAYLELAGSVHRKLDWEDMMGLPGLEDVRALTNMMTLLWRSSGGR